MTLPEGLVLYRGLGGTTDLPDSYFHFDKYGCRGFTEFGFMSTTARKQVAIDYSGINERKPLPMVLEIQVGATDRGACIREFSQYMSEIEYLFAPCSFIEPRGPEALEVSPAGLVRVIPVRVKAGANTSTVEELEKKKKTLHMSAFKYRMHEIELELEDLARKQNAEQRLEGDSSRDSSLGTPITLKDFLEEIMKQCKEVYARHEAVSPVEFNDDSRFRRLALEMVEVREMAEAKLCEWLENTQGAPIRYRFQAKLRTAHRRWIAFLSRRLIKCPDDQKAVEALRLLKTQGLVADSVDEKNELGENRLMAAAAEGRYDVIATLVQASAEVACSRPDGVSAIWLAAQFGQNQTVETLISFKANVNQCANNGASPAYIAAQMGNSKCIKILHDCRADLSQPDQDGLSPVHMAAMNGRNGCISLLHQLGAKLGERNKDGKLPSQMARERGYDECAKMIEELMVNNPPSPLPRASHDVPAVPLMKKKLIITTGDVSDVDGFFALAEYAKTGSDVLFVMNYPAYIGIGEADASDQRSRDYANNNPGLGYRYSATEVLKSAQAVSLRPREYDEFLQTDSEPLQGGDNELMKRALTDLAFCMAVQVWKETGSEGRLFFRIGGINSVNPFSETAIKNEVLVYASLVGRARPWLAVQQGFTYDAEGTRVSLSVQDYLDIYMDFNGSMAFWGEEGEALLGEIRTAESIRGVFIMGGVYADREAVTTPPIPGVLNRFSSATMNQLYHPECSAAFFRFVDQFRIPAYVVTNNSVCDLTTTDPATNCKTLDGVDRFMDANGLTGAYLRSFARKHYESLYNPPRKPYDFYTAKALTECLRSGSTEAGLCKYRMFLFYSNVYGITIVSEEDTWEVVRERYAASINTTRQIDDPEPVRTKKEYYIKELEVLKGIQYMGKLSVFDVRLDVDPETSKLRMPAAGACRA